MLIQVVSFCIFMVYVVALYILYSNIAETADHFENQMHEGNAEEDNIGYVVS